jgi:hypothetical protein
LSLYHPIQPIQYPLITPADNVLLDNPTERTTTSTSYTRLKEIRIFLKGKIRTYFELRSGTAGTTVYGRVYRNGGAFGTERTTTSNTYVSFTEDLDGWFEGDTYQIYGYTSNYTVIAYVRNQQIRGILTTQKPAGAIIL